MMKRTTFKKRPGVLAQPVSIPSHNMTLKDWGLVILLSVLWGCSFFFVGVSVQEIPPLFIVLSRVGIAAVILLLVVHLRGFEMPRSLKTWGAFLVMGALNNVIAFGLITWGQTQIESGLASILNATAPIFSVLLAHYVTRQERITPNKLAGILIGWCGVAVLLGESLLYAPGNQVVAQLAVLGGTFSYSYAAFYAKRLEGLRPIVIAAGTLCGSTIIMLPLVVIFEEPWAVAPSVEAIFSIGGLGIVCTAIAYTVYFRALATVGPTNLLLATFLVPANAIWLGAIGLGESLAWNAFTGMVLILSGLVLIDGRMLRRLQKNL